jgi:hypothetical protein
MRTHGFPATMAGPLFLFRDDAPLKAHPTYRAAKAGDAEAAAILVAALARPLVEPARAAFGPAVTYVAPHAREASGDNAIPQVLAGTLALAVGGELDDGIVQSTRVFHTGANRMERLNSRAEFDGPVHPGSHYVLVDDVTTLGGTLAELADYIQVGGGFVKGVVVMVNASRSDRLQSDPRVVAELEKRHAEAIRGVFGITPAALTGAEARYLIGFRSSDEIRSRSFKARQETGRRLRAKGLGGLGDEAG